MDQSKTIEALERALQAIGPDKLSARLNSPPELIQTWIAGHASMPQRKFLALVDIIEEIGEADPDAKDQELLLRADPAIE